MHPGREHSREHKKMKKERNMHWFNVPGFWKGFLAGGICVPVAIILVEAVVKYLMYGKFFWK